MSIRSLISASALFTIGILVGRVLGLLRETLLAARFGSSEEANIAIALLIIPDFITAALVGSALGAVLIPAFAKRNEDEIMELFWQTMWVSIMAFIVLAAICMAFAYGSSYDSVLQLVFASLPLVGATSALTVYLQYRGRFAVPAFASAIFNAVVLLTLWLSPSNLTVLAIGIVAAVLIRLAAHAAAFVLAGGKKSQRHRWKFGKPLFVAYLQSAGANFLGILPFYLPFAMVAALSIDGFAVFNYAFKLLLFPATLIQTVIQMVLLPWFVKRKAESDGSQREHYQLSLQLGWAISLAVALSMMLAAHDIATICFGYGKMTAEDVADVGQLIAIGIWVTPGIVLLSIYQQILYAHEKPKLVLLVNALIVLLVIILAFIGDMLAGEAGIMAGFVIGQTIPLFVLQAIVSRHLDTALRHFSCYLRISFSIVGCFLPAAWLYINFQHDAGWGVVFAMLIGMFMIVAGLYFCQPVRRKCQQVIRQRYMSS
jgi:peptidoglycan biosynthesis protein MviN/MurJ (putative lipid II flippase)